MPKEPELVCFVANGVLFVGSLLPCAARPPARDDLLVELTWPAGTRVLTDVRLAASDAPVSACVVLGAVLQSDTP